MSTGDTEVRRPTKRLKIEIACDRCRSRKSGCDGKRPSCSQCFNAGVACNYRSSSGVDEVTTSLVGRLTEIDRRLDALENGSATFTPSRAAVNGVRRSHDLKPIEDGHPIVHTGAAYRLLHCWPRIGVKCTLANYDPFTYLDTAEQQTLDIHLREVATGEAARHFDHFATGKSLERSLDALASDHILVLPPVTRALAEYYTGFHPAKLQDRLAIREGSWSSWHPSVDLTTSELCTAILALMIHRDNRSGALAGLRLLLSRLWAVYSLKFDDAWPVLLLCSSLLISLTYCPSQALALLHTAGDAIDRASKIGPIPAPAQWMHFMLECDILTELDGAKSGHYDSAIRDKLAVSLTKPGNATDGQSGSLSAVPGPTPQHVQLRTIQNAVLNQLYGIDMAYCRPLDIADRVGELRRRLDDWYSNLPIDDQFAKDLACRSFTAPAAPDQAAVQLRYFACQFYLNRPVLYFVTHEDLEIAYISPNGTAVNSPRISLPPWVYDSCRVCLESAALASLLITESKALYMDWTSLQLLFGCCLILIHASFSSATAAIARRVGEIGHIVDTSMDFLRKLERNPHIDATLSVLVNVRDNHHRQISP